MAYLLPSDPLAWCDHGTYLGYGCQLCRVPPAKPASPGPLPQPKKKQVGWLCAGCGHSYAPWVPECHHCPVPAEIDGCP